MLIIDSVNKLYVNSLLTETIFTLIDNYVNKIIKPLG